MIKLKYLDLRNPTFVRTMQKIAKSPIKDIKALYNVTRLLDKVQQEEKRSQELFMVMLKEHAVLDDKGNLVPHDGKPGSFQIKEDMLDAWKKKVEDYMDIEWQVERHPLKLSDIASANMTPEEVMSIECVLDQEDLKTLFS